MSNNKQYLIEIPGMEGADLWDADRWERNKDRLLADHPTTNVFEVDAYDPNDEKENDQFLISMPELEGSDVWDADRWKRNKDVFMQDHPEAIVNRVRYVDYWGQKAEANRVEKAALQQPDEERNAKLAELGYYDDLSEGQRVFDLNAPNMVGMKPLSSAIATNSVSGTTEYLDPRVQEFFANDTAYTEKMAEIARLDAEYENNPSIIAQREWEAQMRAEQAKSNEKLEAQIRKDAEADGVGDAQRRQMQKAVPMLGMGNPMMIAQASAMYADAEMPTKESDNYASALNLMDKIKELQKISEKGFGGASLDVARDKFSSWVQPAVVEYNKIGDILTRLESELGNLKEENITPEALEEHLSNDEKALIQAFFAFNRAMADAQQDMSTWYKGGKIFAESVPFMLEFIATGGLYSAASSGTKKGVAWALKKWLTGGAVTKGVARVAKFAGALTGTLARTAVAPSTYNRMAEASIKIDDEGHLHRAKNAAIGFADQYVENLSEISGGLIGDALGWAWKKGGKIAGKVLANTPFAKVGSAIADNALMQSISAFMPKLERLGFHGLPEEIGEEFIGNTIREVTGIQPGALKEMVSDDNFSAMLIGFAPMTLLGAAGGAVSLGVVNYEAAKLGKKMREMMSHQYTEEEIDAMMSIVEGAQDSKEIWQAIKPMAMSIVSAAERGMISEEEMNSELETLYQWGGFMAQNNALVFGKKAQDSEIANAKRAEMVDMYGRFWQEDATESVEIATLNNGNRVFITSAPAEDGKVTTIDVQTGKKGFANVADIATTEVEGEQVPSSTKMTMAAFLNGQIAMGRRTAEETRMANERNAQINTLRAEITPGTKINLGTEGSPIWVFVKKVGNNGVTIVDETGMESTLGWEQAADALGKPIKVETDQQKLDAEITARLQRLAERRMKRRPSPAAQATEEAAEGAAETVAQEQTHIPMNEDGTVNEAAFWMQDPEGYVKWNDEQNQDGGQDSLRQIAIAKQELFGMLNEAATGQNTSNPTMRKAAEKQVAAIADKIAKLEAMEQSYAKSLADNLQETAATPTATMSEEQLELMDAQYQTILGMTRVQSERVRVMQEYLDKLAEGSVPIKVLTAENYEEVMKAANCPESDIARVGSAIRMASLFGTRVAGFASAGTAFVMADTISDINEARITYVHERQHILNSSNNQAVTLMASALGTKENALEVLSKFVNPSGMQEYINDSLERLADEIICRSLEIAYTSAEFSLDLQKKGIPQEVINIINNINDEQQSDKSLTAARRASYANGSPGLRSGENGGNLEQVSGGVLGQEEAGSSRTDNAGVADGGQIAEPAEVISDDEEELNSSDDDALAEEGFEVDEQNEDVRFSIRFLPTPEQRDGIINSIINVTGRTREEAERWLDSELSLASIVLNDKEYLDYAPDAKYKAIKDNSDYPQGTVDFNNICRKRKDFTRMYTRLQRSYPNRIFTAEDLADIRTIMSEDGLVVACGLCYVEDRRQKLGEVADEFIKDLQDGFKSYGKKNATKRANAEKFRSLVGEDTYVPSIYDLITLEGSDKLHDEHKGIWDAFGAYNRARGQQTQNTFQGYAEYKREILTWSDAKVKKVNSLGGLRIFSYSDFEAHHLLDIIQIIIDCAARGVMIQGYTKVPEFARVVEKTGIKLNRSLIPLGDTGIVDGKLAYDPVEGIDINDPNFLESNDNVGNILIGINDEQIRMAMADPFIHYIIPYHARQAGNIRAKLNVGAWTNYIDTQNERKMSDGKRVEKNINIYTDVLNESITNDREFVEKYLEVCREKGYIPKFDQFLDRDAEGNYVYTPGYYKFLVDFKLFDEAGNILPQKPVVAQFDDAFNAQILNDYAREQRETAGTQMNSTYEKIVESLDLGEPTEGENVRFSIKDNEGPIDLIEEAQKAEDRHVMMRVIGEVGAKRMDDAVEANTLMDNLAIAREMEEAGKDAKTIKMATGWERGADNKWRLEMEDFEFKAKPGKKKTFKLSDLIADEALFAAYPELADVKVKYTKLAKGKGGQVDTVDGVSTIKINEDQYRAQNPVLVKASAEFMKNHPEIAELVYRGRMYAMDAEQKAIYEEELKKVFRENEPYIDEMGGKGTLVHEIQHIIQHIEGFAEGGNSSMTDTTDPAAREEVESLQRILNIEIDNANDLVPVLKDLFARGRAAELSGDIQTAVALKLEWDKKKGEWDKHSANINFIKRELRKFKSLGYEGYRKLAGEVEARNAEQRMNMSYAERRNTLLSETEDVAREEQIFLRDNVMMKAEEYQASQELVPGHKKGEPMLSDAEMMADVVSFRITKNTKATIEKWFNKAGVDAEMTEATINYLDYAFEDTTEQLCAAKWYLNGKISLPDEDEYKVRDAVKVAKQNKVDALSYASPMDILNTFGQPKSKVKAIDPDTIKEFSNKQELAEGIVVYDVQDDFEGQAAVRKIIDTHWGEDANPWCLAARTNGDLERAKDMWLHYSKYPKRIAFRNGRLLAFYASANDKTWWDRNDEPHTNIPYSVKSKEGEYEVSTNYELKEGNKKAKKVSVGKSDKKGRTAYFVGNRLDSAGIQDGERNLFYSSFPAGATLSDSTYGVGRSLEVQYGPYKNVTQISFERRTKDEPTYYVRVGYGNNGVRAISFVEGARSWDIRYGINGDQIFVGRAQLNFDLTDQLSDVYSGAYHMYRINDEEYEISRGTKKVGIVRMGEKVTMQMLEAFGEDGAPAGALLDFINDNGWNRADYPYPNPADADLLRRDDEVREQIRKVENEINEIAGGRYLSSVPAIRFRMSNENQTIFVSNAARAVEGIKQEKATPEQWLKMIEKAGGLKAGEDKWMGLSDWLKASDRKTLTKQEVLDFINQNMIIIEEVHYIEGSDEDFREMAEDTRYALQEIYDDYIAESEEMTDDMYMSTHYDYAIQKLAERLGYEAWNAPFVNMNATIRLDLDPEFAVAELNDIRKRLGMASIREERSINETRLGYTTNGLVNLHEIALTVPTIDPYYDGGEIHFSDAGDGRAIAWIRFGDASKWSPEEREDGKKGRTRKVLVIDEIQSQRHQKGRERGYMPNLEKEYEKKEAIFLDAQDAYINYLTDVHNISLGSASQSEIESLRAKDAKLQDLWEIMKDAEGDLKDVGRRQALQLSDYRSVPDAPFDKNWHELAMKRMLRYAAENGYDVVAWTKGDQQAERYNIGNLVREIISHETESGRIVDIRSKNNEDSRFVVDAEGKIIDSRGPIEANDKMLSDVVGKEVAKDIMEGVGSDITLWDGKQDIPAKKIDGDGLRIGGEGMKGFYDKMLPTFMNKYGKKWGIKVEDMYFPGLEGGLTMHSVPVTEEMKSSVMEGQVMFRTTDITPEVQDEMNAIHASAIVMGNFMKAPNGKDTNLTEEQWLMVRTKNFRDWFGDWLNDPENASKVVDENGEPKVVFHGGAWRPLLEEKGNAVFKMRSGLMGRGAYFTDNFTTAADYAREKYEWENYQEVDEDFVYDNGYITEAFLNIRNEDDIREYYGETFYLATSPNQIKSAIDNTGEFSEGEGDIRFKVVTDSAKIEELESGEKIKVYRAMQLIDGKLYPPMSAKVDGQLREPIELGQWEEAEERPDLADNKGYFKLDKGNKKSLKARYNPYFHTSYTPLNDQFSEAQDRPNLVTVEVEIPVSELTSGYKADKAKDSVGEKEWKAGVIQGKLSGTRKVILSRWDKPIRIVPDSEVADVIVKMFEGKDIVMPSNVVTPSLRAELESRGVPFVETDNQGKKLTNIAEMTTPIWSSKGTFANLAEAEEWAHKNLQGKSRVNRYTGERISIGSNSISKMLSPKAQKQSSSISAHLAALKSVLDFIKTGIPAEVHADQEGRDFNVLRLYNAIEIDNKLYRVKSTVRKVRQGDKFYTYEVQEMELIEERWSSQKGEADNPRNPDSPINSITGAKLLKGVKKSNSNENILPESENVSFRVNENPTEAQKEAGNYKMGHLNLDGYRITIENPKGSVRRGTDSKGNAWENTLNNDYGYIRGTEGVDGDHIDVYLSDNPSEGNVFVIDQVNPQTREFDEHKVMYGFNSAEEAREAYLANFSEGWNGLGIITEVSKDEFKRWIQSSHRKTKPFSEYKSVNDISMQSEGMSEEITTGTPTEEIVAEGMSLSPAQLASLAGDIFAALPEDSRKKITDGLNGNILGLQDAILQIPTSLAAKEEWDDEDKQMAKVVRDVMQNLVDANPTSRPLTTKEALWMLYDSTYTVKDLVDAASRAFVAHNLGFDQASKQRKQEENDYIRFRTASQGAIDAATDMYNYETSLWTERLKESWLDMNQSVVSLQNAMETASGMAIEPWENIVFALNRLSSKSYADKKKYMRDFLIPMWDAVMEIVKVDGKSIEEIERYMMLKHGLERNKKFASRDAKEFYRAMYDLVAERMKNQSHAQQVVALSEAKKKLADIDAQIAVASSTQLPRLNEARARAKYDVEVADLVLRGDEKQNETELQAYYDNIDNELDSKYWEFREKDYGGLTSMFVDAQEVKRSNYKSEEAYQKAVLAATTPKFDKVADMEAEAQAEVDYFERVVGAQNLWDKVNAATKETLRHQYESGMITIEQYEAVRDMFEYYVPLRGFADNTAEDMYSYYMNNSAGGFAKPILGAKGRKTRAESPLGWIGTMAESAIQADNKNEAKMCLYYAASRRPDLGLISITETWYEYTGQKDANGKKIFKPVFPPAVDHALNADELRQHMEDWEDDMKKKQSRGEAYKGSQSVNLRGSVVFQDVKEEKEHVIRVKVAGKDYSIMINGNPRAAQAINGLLNPDANVGPVAQWIGDARRNLSALLTSYSPLFWVANFQRDLLSSTMRISEADGWDQAMKYLANRRHAWRVASYVYKQEAGTLGNSYYENLYREFAENGGITGYTSLTTNKEYEKLLEDYAKNVDRKTLNAVKGAWDKFMGFGEAIEQVSRFAAYITARESGKPIEEAINAAKEVSVNFNRKGSAKPISLDELDKLRTKSGKKLNKAQRIAALVLSAMPGPMKFAYYFVNASIQVLSSSVKLAKKSPGKATTWVGLYMGTSIALAMLNYLLSDDDDDEYLNLPDYLRHSTILVKVSDGYYFKWSIPQEMRPFYAWADILVRKIMGKSEHKNGREVGIEMALAASQWLPVNPFEAEDPLLSLVPDFLSPLAELKANQNAFGGRIYDDMPYKSEGVVAEIPAYRKATEKTGKIYVDMAEFLNEFSGGNEVEKGWANINPAKIEHIVEGYGGGIYDFAKLMVSLPSLIFGDEPVEVKKIPFVNKVVLSVDETNMYSHTNEAFYHYKNVADNAKRVEKEYRESDDPSRADAYREEEDWRIYLLYKQYEQDFKDVKERLDNAVDKEEEALLKQEQNVLREMFLDNVAKGDIPEVTFQIREDVKRFDKEIKAIMRPVTEANKERLERKKAGDVDGMLEAIERRDSLKDTPEYKRAEELNADLKILKKQLSELGSVTRGSQRDSVIGELQKNYNALVRKMAE